MTISRRQEEAGPVASFGQCLRKEIETGIGLAADPINANLPDDAPRLTTIHSPWYSRTCRVCKHKFREGDWVRLCPLCGEPYHDDPQYGLYCWQEKFAGGQICTEGGLDRFSGLAIDRCEFSPGPQERQTDRPGQEQTASPPTGLVTQFVGGLERIWRPFGEQPAIKVAPGDPAVGRSCPWCRFRIRAGDWVVACPCGCGAYFHQDIFRHLTCWNEWHGVEGNDYCPITGRPYSPEEADERD